MAFLFGFFFYQPLKLSKICAVNGAPAVFKKLALAEKVVLEIGVLAGRDVVGGDIQKSPRIKLNTLNP